MGPPLFILFVYGLWRFASNVTHVTHDSRVAMFVWMASVYLLQTFISHKGPHNSIGILIPAAVISAVGIASLPRHRYTASALVVGFAALQFAILTLPESRLGARIGTFGWSGVVPPFPRNEGWQIEHALQAVATQPARVAVVSDHIFINAETAKFYTARHNLALDVTPCWRLGPGHPPDLSKFDIVLAKSDDAWIRPKAEGCFRSASGRDEYAALMGWLHGSHTFAETRRLPLPDGSYLLVFQFHAQ
jgi:hypothetical protein